MTGISMGAGVAAAEKFPWGEFKSFVDVGCAQGGFTAQVAFAHLHLTAVASTFRRLVPSLTST